ncbi:MAG: hypothetical protein VX988_09685 [Planctomycetota bacterium]|nr:hypothetical protein [Planctomycetota bacterium]
MLHTTSQRRSHIVGVVLILSFGASSAPSAAAAGVSEASGYTTATGPIDRDLEGFFFFDSLTGELKAVALNPRTKQFVAVFSRKINEDFSPKGEARSGQRFLMATGVANLSPEPGVTWRWAASAIYVTELNSGVVAAYGIKLPQNLRNVPARQPIVGDITPFDKLELREKSQPSDP